MIISNFTFKVEVNWRSNTMNIENTKHILIYIEKINCGVASGVFFNTYLNKVVAFNCLEQLILKIDQLNEVLNCCDDKNRGLKSALAFPKIHTDLNIHWFPVYFFSLEIIFERNNSWQGSFRCAKTDKVYYFKSVLQLIKQFAKVMDLAKEPLFDQEDLIITM